MGGAYALPLLYKNRKEILEMAIRVVGDVPVQDESGNLLHIQDMFGLSDDSKPTTGLATGSSFVEVDTGKAFLFDESSSSWMEQ